MNAAYVRRGPAQSVTGLLLSVPHAGRDYRGVDELARVPLPALLPLEDRYADRLVERAVAAGHVALVATRARAFIDLNRDVADLDLDMVLGEPAHSLSPRARAGLGLIPRRLAPHGELWRRKLTRAELTTRLACHRAYHQALHDELAPMAAPSLLLDIHSMPPVPQVDIVLGDRHGRSCDPALTDAAAALLARLGFRVARNHPYAGGHITAAFGQPQHARFALQIEISRALYLDREERELGPGLPAVQRAIAMLADALGTLLRPAALAAE